MDIKTPEEKILEFLQNNKEQKFSMLELSKKTGINYVTIQKYVIILQNKNLIEVKDLGNMKLIGLRREANEQQNR